MKVTLVNGSPYIHFEKNGLGTVSFTYFNGMRIIHESDGTLAVYLGDVRSGYAIFAPAGTQFNYTLANLDLKELSARGKITMTLPSGQSRFSVAVLPNEINDIFKAPTQYTELGYVVQAGKSVNELPTHIEGSQHPLVVARLVGDFFREDEEGDGIGVEELDELIQDYRHHAFAVPTSTRFDYRYDEDNSTVISDYRIETQLAVTEPGLTATTLMGLYRHQYINAGELDYVYTYATPRGTMKVIKANQFQTRIPHIGLIPNLPNALQGDELNRLLALLEQDKQGQWSDGLTQNDVLDTYNNGKELNWMVQLLHIAKQTGRTDVADTLMNHIKSHLEDWLSADDWQQDRAYNNSHCNPMAEPQRSECYRNLRLANEKKYFYYNEEWNSLTGFPASFGSDTELNDHHFHAGYLISAAATIARYDRNWATQWKPMVDLLIKDSANWDREDTRFQYLRYFDIYNGYSLANGHLNMDAGGNQESSSESINFAQAVAFWGSETDDKTIRDLGIFLYASEIQAIHQYWFDVDGEVFPKQVFWDNGSQFMRKDFDRESVGLVWHSKADYGTWFSAAPRMIAGINFLPITGASLHLGHMQKTTGNNATEPVIQLIMDRLNEDTRFFAEELWHRDLPTEFQQYDFRRKTHFWDDLMWEAEALVDPQSAADKFTLAGNYKREFDPSLPPLYPNAEVRGEAGESKTHTYHWIYNLLALGTPVKGITADTPHFAVFEKNGVRTRVVYNPTADDIIVRFSDGAVINVGPHQLSGGNNIEVAPAVTGLVADNITDSSADIHWEPLSGDWAGAEYRVQLSTSSGDLISEQTLNGNQMSLTQLQASTPYRLRVTPLFEGIEGNSASINFRTEVNLDTVPAVQNLEANDITENAVQLSWNAIPEEYTEVDYRITVYANNNPVQDISSTAGATNYNLTGLTPDTTYAVSVWARNSDIESTESNLTFTTEPEALSCDPSTQPYCIEAAATSINITLNRNAAWADIRLTSPAKSGGYRMPKTADGKSYFEITGLSQGNIINFEFTYFDTVGHDLGPFTYTHQGSNEEKEDVPAVTGLSTTNISENTATASWTPLNGSFAGATYEIELLLGTQLINTYISTTGTTSFTGLVANTNYTVSVKAVLNNQKSSAATHNFTTQGDDIPPPNCQLVSGESICADSNNGQLIVSLQATGWAVIHTNTGNYGMSPDGTGKYTYAFQNLTSGTTVNAWFTINTNTGAKDTAWVSFVYDENSITIPPVTGLQTSTIGDTQVTLSWVAPSLEAGSPNPDYRIKIFKDSSQATSLASTNGQTNASISGLTSGTSYRAEVETLLDGAASVATAVSFVTTGDTQNNCLGQPGDICATTVNNVLRISVYGASGWAIIHYAAGNYHMTSGSEGVFYFDLPSVPVGGSVSAWFTINKITGAYDTSAQTFTRTE